MRKIFVGVYMVLVVGAIVWLMIHDANHVTKYHYDNRVAAGEWHIEVQTPPCDGVGNIQVIYPQQSGYPIEIECDQMPVGEK